MRCLAFSVLSIAMATRASGIREAGPRSCSERVALVLDGVYGRYFAQKIGQLLLDDPFATSQDTKEDLMKRLRKSMLFHCELFESQKSCDGVRNARFQERMGKRNERVFPAKISPKDSSCFKNITKPGPQRDRCVMVQCYRELVEKNCRDVVPQNGQSKVEGMRLRDNCL